MLFSLTSKILLIITLMTTSFAWAWPPTYGAEFEVGTKALDYVGEFDSHHPGASLEKKEQMAFVEHMKTRCVTLGCTVTAVSGKWDKDYKVEFPDGWFFKVSYDPACVEITFKPSSLQTLREKAALIDDAIFKTAHDLDMYTPVNKMNHFNVGIRSAFDDSPKDFLKYFVDYANHPDLALGSLGHDTGNAPPLSVLGEDQREALQKVIEDFQAGKIKTLNQIAGAIQRNVYTRSYISAWGGADHYQAFGLKYVNRTDLTQKDAPFELRSVWGQPDIGTFNRVAELMEARMQYLRNSSAPIVYTASSRTKFDSTELKTRFFIYVEETGLKFENFQSLLKPFVLRKPLSPFVDTAAPIEERLKAIDGYWDLVLTSPLARKTVLSITSDPAAQGNPMAAQVIERLKADLRPAGTGRVMDGESAKILQDFLQDLLKPAAPANMCSRVFAI